MILDREMTKTIVVILIAIYNFTAANFFHLKSFNTYKFWFKFSEFEINRF